MEEGNTGPGSDKYVLTIVGYVIGIILIVLAHGVAPTNMAGPGLDIPVFLLVLIAACVSTMRNVLARVNHNKPLGWLVFVNVLGNFALIGMLFF